MLEKQIWMGFFFVTKEWWFSQFLKMYGNFPNLMALVPIPPPKQHENMVFVFLN